MSFSDTFSEWTLRHTHCASTYIIIDRFFCNPGFLGVRWSGTMGRFECKRPIVPATWPIKKKQLPRMWFFKASHSITQLSTWPPCHIGGCMHSEAQLTLFSSFSLGKISKFLLRSLVRQFAGSSSVKFLFLLLARQNKQVSFALAYASVNFVFLLLARQNKQASFALAYASVPAHVEMMGFLGIGQVMRKWVNGNLFTFTTNAAITRLRQNPMVGATVDIAVDIATALSK